MSAKSESASLMTSIFEQGFFASLYCMHASEFFYEQKYVFQ